MALPSTTEKHKTESTRIPRRTTAILRNLLAVLLAVLFAAVVFEVALRRKFPPFAHSHVGEFANQKSPDLVEDPFLGWRLRPNHVFGPDGIYRTNSQGFRSDHEFDASPDTRKVVLVGDSFTFGWKLPANLTFAALLEQRLHGTAVYNLGIPSFGIDQIWLALRHYGLPLNPKLAIIVFISGDFNRSEEAYRDGFNKPTLKLSQGQLVPKTSQDSPSAVREFLEMHSSLWRIGSLSSRTMSHQFPIGEWWFLNRAILDHIRSDCAAAGITPLFVYIPTDELGEFPNVNSYMRKVGANFIDMAEKGRFPMVGTRLPDRHPNGLGNRYIADSIGAWIAANRPDL